MLCHIIYQREGASLQAPPAPAANHAAVSGLAGEAPPFGRVRTPAGEAPPLGRVRTPSGTCEGAQLQVAVGRHGADPGVWGEKKSHGEKKSLDVLSISMLFCFTVTKECKE